MKPHLIFTMCVPEYLPCVKLASFSGAMGLSSVALPEFFISINFLLLLKPGWYVTIYIANVPYSFMGERLVNHMINVKYWFSNLFFFYFLLFSYFFPLLFYKKDIFFVLAFQNPRLKCNCYRPFFFSSEENLIFSKPSWFTRSRVRFTVFWESLAFSEMNYSLVSLPHRLLSISVHLWFVNIILFLDSHDPISPLVIFGLLPHEQKVIKRVQSSFRVFTYIYYQFATRRMQRVGERHVL